MAISTYFTLPLVDLHDLHGAIVLLQSRSDRHEPPAGMRGTIEVDAGAEGEPVVKLVWDIPDMFNQPAHRRTVTLKSEASLRRLLASEKNGVYEFALEQELD